MRYHGPRAIHLLAPMLVACLFLVLLFKHISYPLLWHDESDTVMFGQRVLEYGYPKVHGAKNVLYGLEERLEVGVDERFDAYVGAPWGHYYFAAIGVALAQKVDDLYANTALLRLPFATIGALGLLILLLGVLGSVDGWPRRRIAFATLYWALAAYSVSLILHLREARYYGLLVFLTSTLCAVFFRYHVFGRLGYRAYVASLTLLLFLLFNTFYPAYPVFLAAMGLYLGGGVLLTSAPPRERWHSLLRSVLPLFLSLILTLPLLLYFEFLHQVRGWMDSWDTTLGAYLANLGTVLANFLRYEFLAPALAARLGVALLARLRPDDGISGAVEQRRRISTFLLVLAASYWLIVGRTPFIWERYFIAMSPVISVMFLLDVFSLWDLSKQPSRPPRWLAGSVVAAVAACLAVTWWERIPEFRGRLHEITHRYQGPLDFVIPYLKDKYENPEDLIIATNYEDPVYMYYLGSRVIVGYYGADLARDLELQPDVIVPRRWERQRDSLRLLAARARYETKSFPIAPLLPNNIPGLSPRSPGGIVHQFRTRLAAEGAPRLVILERVPDAPK